MKMFVSRVELRHAGGYAGEGAVEVAGLRPAAASQANALPAGERSVRDATEGRKFAEHGQRFAAIIGFHQRCTGRMPQSVPKQKYTSDYCNYKRWYSVILLALVERTCKFLYVNICYNTRNHDTGV